MPEYDRRAAAAKRGGDICGPPMPNVAAAKRRMDLTGANLAPRVAGFLGKKITPQSAQEIGSWLSTRIEGRCIRHYMGAAGRSDPRSSMG